MDNNNTENTQLVENEIIIENGDVHQNEIFPGAKEKMLKIPAALIIPIAYLLIGKLLHIWHPTWLMFFFIPIYYQLAEAVGTTSKKAFLLNLPIVPIIVSAYITLGLFLHLWGDAWLLFLLIPVYYWVAARVKD